LADFRKDGRFVRYRLDEPEIGQPARRTAEAANQASRLFADLFAPEDAGYVAGLSWTDVDAQDPFLVALDSAAIEVELTAGVNFYGTETPEDEIPFVRAVGEGQPPESLELAAATAPLGRVGYPADIAAAVAFVASDDACYIIGTTIAVDGGLLSQQRSPQVETFPVSSFPPLPPKEEP
jgi:Enoyl-(Acyl carrier protein) reductase